MPSAEVLFKAAFEVRGECADMVDHRLGSSLAYHQDFVHKLEQQLYGFSTARAYGNSLKTVHDVLGPYISEGSNN